MEYLDHLTLSDGFLPTLKRLCDEYKLAMLSNDVADWSRHLRSKFHLDEFFELYVISGDCGIRKPDEGIYEYALSQELSSSLVGIQISESHGQRHETTDCMRPISSVTVRGK